MKKFKILLFLGLTSLLTGNVFASTIDKIDVVNNNTVKITASNDVVFSDSFVQWDIKVLKDINVSYSSIDSNNSRKVVLNLSDDLLANTSYSLITILWAKGNIDFKIWDYLKGPITNKSLKEWEEWIEKINIIDSRTLEVSYNYDLTDNMFEFKVLSDIITNWLFSKWNNIVDLGIKWNLEKESNYILMILDLEDNKGNKLVFDQDLYDFATTNDLKINTQEADVVLASAKEEKPAKWNIAEVAQSTDEIPDTGSATWVLVLLTVIVNLAFFLRKKLIK